MKLPSKELYIVDVFTESKFAGNQLAVVRNAASISDEEMQRIAREMNFSETTFILSDKKQKDDGYDVRIFTPKEELPFAGHPTLGTAYVIQREVIRRKVDAVKLNLKIGQIRVTFNNKDAGDILWMKQAEPKFGREISKEEIGEIISLGAEAFVDKFPVQIVSTGLPTIIVPLRDLQSVKNARINREKYFKFVENSDSKTILVFCPEAYDKKKNQLNVRVFVDYFGVPEDPATGSGNGCLAAYLVRHRYFGENRIDVRAEQGYEIGRPSLILLKSSENADGTIDVNVGGHVEMIVKGELEV